MFAPLAPTPRFALAGLLAGALLLSLACSRSNRETPADTDPLAPAPAADTSGAATPLAFFDLVVSGNGPQVTLTPIDTREGAAQGDSYEANITPFLLDSPCTDCLQVTGFGLTPDFDLWVDIALMHPFKYSGTVRPDLVVYDPRVILIPELDFFATPLTKFIYDDSPLVNGTDQISGVWDLVRNADGYTAHYDIPTDLLGGPPLFMGSVNPFKFYFTEDDPAAEFTGAEIPAHAMGPGDGPDIQRWLIDVTDPDQAGFVDRRFKVAVEASWGQGTTKVGRISGNPPNLIRLPEYNMKEAYGVRTTLPQTFFGNTFVGTPVFFDVLVSDWQNSTIAGTATTQVNCPSDVASVTVDLPGIDSPGLERIMPVLSQSSPASGAGTLGDPYVFNFVGPTSPNPDLAPLVRQDPYLALVRVEDDYNDAAAPWGSLCQPGGPDADGRLRGNFPPNRANTVDPLSPIHDFVAYRIVPVFVRNAGPPTIDLNPPLVDTNKGLVTLSGQVTGLDMSVTTITPIERRDTIVITQVGPGGPPMNSPWTLPLQIDDYGRFTIVMALLPGGNNTFTVRARNQYPAFQTSNAAYPPVGWNPLPALSPSFRVSLAWEPVNYANVDPTDLDIHIWEPIDPAPSTLRHLYYCNGFGGQNCSATPDPIYPNCGLVAKPCTVNGDVITQTIFRKRADAGFGVEVVDGVNSASVLPSRSFAVGVNYFTNRYDMPSHPITVRVRVASFGIPNNLQYFTTVLDRENFNNGAEFYAAAGNPLEYDRSWYRPCDLSSDGSGNVSIGGPAINEAFLFQ